MPTAQDMGAVGYERAGWLFQAIATMLSGIAAQGSTYITTTLWESVRSFYVGWRWAMEALNDGFKAAAYDPTTSSLVTTSLGNLATNASSYFGTTSGGRGYISAAAAQALQSSQAYNNAAETWAGGASHLFQRVAEVYSLFWRNAP